MAAALPPKVFIAESIDQIKLNFLHILSLLFYFPST